MVGCRQWQLVAGIKHWAVGNTCYIRCLATQQPVPTIMPPPLEYFLFGKGFTPESTGHTMRDARVVLEGTDHR